MARVMKTKLVNGRMKLVRKLRRAGAAKAAAPRLVRREKLKGLVNKIISGNSETKVVSYRVQQNTVHNSGITTPDVARLIPAIGRGEESYQRDGDEVTPVSLFVKGRISMDRNYATDNRVLLARVMMISNKSDKYFPSALSKFTGADLLRPSDESGLEFGPFAGNPLDVYYPINEEVYRVHYDKVFKIAPCKGTLEAGGVEENPSSEAYFSTEIDLPKKLTFPESVDPIVPNNAAPFLVIGYAFADGTGPDLVATRLISNVVSILKFKDY